MPDTLPGKRVLVVEDNPALAYDVDDALRDCGAYVVGPAFDLETARSFAAAMAIDGAVLDIDLCGEFVWPLAHDLMMKGVPFVFVSADSADDLPADFQEVRHITKPARTEQIVALVGQAIRGR